MREIKFRLWYKGQMIYHVAGMSVHAFMITPDGLVFLRTEPGKVNGDGHTAILLQYTGLKDKNGKEIYEGDILRSFHFKDDKKEYFLLHRVVWDQEHTGWEAASLSNKSDNLTLAGNTQLWVYKRNAENPEVIGNIYENAELLTNDKARVSS